MDPEFVMLTVPTMGRVIAELLPLVGGAVVYGAYVATPWANAGDEIKLAAEDKETIAQAYAAHDKAARPEYYEVRHGGKDAARGIKHSTPKAVHYRPGRRA